MRLLILFSCLGPLAYAKVIFWRPNNNWSNANNWQLNHIPCGNERVSFPDNALVFLSSRVSFSELEFPAESLFVFETTTSLEANTKRAVGAQCKFASNRFTATFQKWYEPSNWCTSMNDLPSQCDAASDLSKRVAPLLSLPCDNDRVVFPVNSTYQVEIDLFGPSVFEAAIKIGSLSVDGVLLSSIDAFRQYYQDDVAKRTFRVNFKSISIPMDEAIIFSSPATEKGGTSYSGCEGNLQRADKICEMLVKSDYEDRSENGIKCPLCDDSASTFRPIGSCCPVCERGLFALWMQSDRNNSQYFADFLDSLDVAMKRSADASFVYSIQPVNSSFVQVLLHSDDGKIPEAVLTEVNELSRKFAIRSAIQPEAASAGFLTSAEVSGGVAIGAGFAIVIGLLIIGLAVGWTFRRSFNRDALSRCFDVNCVMFLHSVRHRMHQATLRRRASAELRAADFIAKRLGEESADSASVANESMSSRLTGNANDTNRSILNALRDVSERVSQPFNHVAQVIRAALSYSNFTNETDETDGRRNETRVARSISERVDTSAPQSFVNPSYDDVSLASASTSASAYVQFTDIEDRERHSELQQAIHAFAGHEVPSPTGSAAEKNAAAPAGFKRSFSSSSGSSQPNVLHMPSISEFVELEMSTNPRTADSDA